MRTELFLKTQAQLRRECEARLTDSANYLATPEQYLAALNEAVLAWHGRVTLPKLYNLSDAFTAGSYEYALPPHVAPPFDLQIRSSSYVYMDGQTVVNDNDSNLTWGSMAGYKVEPTIEGGWLLRLPISPTSQSGRIVYWGQNGPMPTTYVRLRSFATDAATTLELYVEDAPDIAPNGWVNINNEWISYGDIIRYDSEVYDLTHCTRGLYGTHASSHPEDQALSWGVGVDDQRLWLNLYDYVTFYIHALQIHKGTSEDVSRHEKLVSFYETKHMNFWRTQGYISQRKASRLQTPQSLGVISW